jgi:hypothetical protein
VELSTQREALVDLCVREKLLLDSIEAYLLELGGGIINRRKRTLVPVVRERAQLADSLTRRLQALSLERRKAEAQDLGRYLADRYGAGSPCGEKQSDADSRSPDRDRTFRRHTGRSAYVQLKSGRGRARSDGAGQIRSAHRVTGAAWRGNGIDNSSSGENVGTQLPW